jgi:hypothetical protein
MGSSLIRAISVAALGAIAGAACMALAFVRHPEFTLDMDRDLPRNVTGIYPPEFIPGGESFAWTGRSAKISLPGVDRRVPWECTVRLRGGRTPPLTLPAVELAVDGARAAVAVSTNTFSDVIAPVPAASARAGMVLTITVSQTFVPGPGDARELGVQVDRVECRPVEGQLALPPRRGYVNAMLAGGIFGAAFGAIGITAGSAVGAILLLVFAQALPLAAGPASYVAYADRAPWLAFWIAGAMVAVIRAFDRGRQRPLRQTARFVVAFAAAALYLKLLAILHPATPLIDAVFQAHRLEWVLGGRYFFTQLMPGGVQFPYAIGLYVFAAPWSALTGDHVTLLRIVVCTSECVAGALLYPMIVRAWGDRLAGAIAAALFTAVPIAYWVVGNGNLTNAFAQAIALIAVAVVVLLAPGRVRAATVAAWTALIALALLSHVTTLAVLGFTVLVLAVLFRWPGGAPLRRAAGALLIALALATAFAAGVYYRHFGDVFVNAMRVRASPTATSPSGDAGRAAAAPSRAPAATGSALHVRIGRSLKLVADSIGWPILILAGVGAWRLGSSRGRDPLRLALAAWAITFAVFFAVGVMRVGPEFERYSLEFVGRVAHATYPAAVIAAGYGAAWAWRSRAPLRVTGLALLALAMAIGVREWMQWR